jgi:hypothetical protein
MFINNISYFLKLHVIKLPNPSSCKFILPVEMFTDPGFKYSPNKLEGIEITVISFI